MKTYGLKPEHLKIIRDIFQANFKKESDVKVFLFGSRAKGEHHEFSDIDLAFKSKKENLSKILPKIKDELEESKLPYKVDIVNWDEIVETYLPQIKKQKIPFWNPDQIELISPWRVCPIGEHWVKRHNKNLKTGTITDTDGHCRKNKAGRDVLKGDEIDLIAQMSIFKNLKVQAGKSDLGFKERGGEYDRFINGWTAYWNHIFSNEAPLNPNWIKALIATESSFNPLAKGHNESKRIGPARGLIQVTEESARILKNQKGEIKDYYVDLTYEELWEPNKNICAGIRWLFHKRNLARRKLKREPDFLELQMAYKGRKRNNEENRKIQKKLIEFLGKLEK